MNPLVLNNLKYGMYAVGVKDGDKPSASIVCVASQIASTEEPLIAISVNKASYTAYCIKKNGYFTLSVLSEDTPASIIGVLGLVSGRKIDKLQNIRYKKLIEGVPVIKENTCCWFLCKNVKTVEVGDQYLFIGQTEAGSEVSYGKPMTYDYYKEVLKGTVSSKCPAYISPDKDLDKRSEESFVCSVCGYIYNDPNFGFDELQKSWHCPVCKMPKSAFVRK